MSGKKYPFQDVAVSFSGGLDTTLGVILLLEHFERVHLNIFCNGYCLRVHAPHERVEQLRRIYGKDRIICKTSASRSSLEALMPDYGGDLRRTGSPLIFDLCCRFSMEIELIKYCLRHNISHAMDGLNSAQPVIFMLMPEYIELADQFMEHYRIQYLHPVYHFGDREKRRKLLDERGLNVEVKAISLVQRLGILPQISEQITLQPLCYAQLPIFLLTSPIRHAPVLRKFGLPLELAQQYRLERQELAREHIRQRLRAAGHDVEVLLAERDEPADVKPLFPDGL